MPSTAFLKELGSAKDAERIRRWFANDAEGNRRLEFYGNPDTWFSLFGQSRRGWFVVVDEQPVGLVDMDWSGGVGSIAYYVAPEYRGRGYGNESVRLMVEQARTLGLGSLEGDVDPDNAASIAALRAAGFELLAFDDEQGMYPVKIML